MTTLTTDRKGSIMRSQTPVPAGRAGGIYDVIVTAGFATPWTADFILGRLGSVHESLGLPGDAMPDFDTSHLLFVSLFGIVVTMWGVVRALLPTPLLIITDTVGRAAFALTFVWALAAGHSTVLIGFVILELGWLVAQARGVLKTLAAERPSHVSHSAVEALPA